MPSTPLRSARGERALRIRGRSVGSLLLGLLALAGCDWVSPTVVVHNRFAAMQVSEVSFNGCVWPETLAPGAATSPSQCLPGSGRVYFKLFDPASPALGWQGRKTSAAFDAAQTETLSIDLDEAGSERDYETPGPYGH